MIEEVKKEPTCQVAIKESVMERLRGLKEVFKTKHKRVKIQDMTNEALSIYCDHVEKELGINE
jgi:hypothetical protein